MCGPHQVIDEDRPLDFELRFEGSRVGELLLEAAMRTDERSIDTWGPIVEMQRDDLELAWREIEFLDSAELRDARSRMCIARQSTLQCVITFDFWAADLERCEAAWETVLATIQLGEFIADPTRGPLVF